MYGEEEIWSSIGLKQDVKNSLKSKHSILQDWLHIGPGTVVKLLGSLVMGSEYSQKIYYSQIFLGLSGERKEGSRMI